MDPDDREDMDAMDTDVVQITCRGMDDASPEPPKEGQTLLPKRR